jgi:hypothetical protein
MDVMLSNFFVAFNFLSAIYVFINDCIRAVNKRKFLFRVILRTEGVRYSTCWGEMAENWRLVLSIISCDSIVYRCYPSGYNDAVNSVNWEAFQVFFSSVNSYIFSIYKWIWFSLQRESGLLVVCPQINWHDAHVDNTVIVIGSFFVSKLARWFYAQDRCMAVPKQFPPSVSFFGTATFSNWFIFIVRRFRSGANWKR